MYNQPHPARADVPWQPNAGIAQKLSSRGYATTSWSTDEPQAYAELGYPPKLSGFSAAHYQSTNQTLSKQAQASLALFEGENRNELFGEEKPSAVSEVETNEHLPFVMDAYGATRKSKLRVKVDPSVLERALAQAEMAESLVVSPITSDDKVADPIVIHPDVPDTVSVKTLAAESGGEQTALAQDGESSETSASVENQQGVTTSSNETATDLDAIISEPLKPELPTVVGGIAPEEVQQREAEQFAKGLAQAREEAQVQLAEAIEKARQEGLAQGREQGLEQGLTEGRAQGLDEGFEKGKTQGLEEGLQQGLQQGIEQGIEQGKAEGEQTTREALAEEMAAHQVVFENAAQELSALIEDPKKFFEPLKRLALHIAEQVVLGELQTSSKSVERLVQRCLDELDHPVHGAVVLELNPLDKELLQKQSADFTKGMRLEAVHDMQRGSVRVFANDTIVEDLVEHRLKGLAQALLVDEDAWHERSPLTQDISEVQREAEDGDVHS